MLNHNHKICLEMILKQYLFLNFRSLRAKQRNPCSYSSFNLQRHPITPTFFVTNAGHHAGLHWKIHPWMPLFMCVHVKPFKHFITFCVIVTFRAVYRSGTPLNCQNVISFSLFTVLVLPYRLNAKYFRKCADKRIINAYILLTLFILGF